MKKVKTPETLALKKSFKYSMQDSKELSSAVQQVANIHKLYEKREELKPLLDGIESIKTGVAGSEHASGVAKLIEISESLNRTFEGIDQYMENLDYDEIQKTSNFEGLKVVFEEARKIPSVLIRDADWRNIGKLMDSLSDKYDDVKKSVEVLKNLELRFSEYALERGAVSLKELDKSFKKFAKMMMPPKPPMVWPPEGVTNYPHPPRVRKEPETNYEMREFLLWGLPCLVLLFVLCFAEQLNYIWNLCRGTNY